MFRRITLVLIAAAALSSVATVALAAGKTSGGSSASISLQGYMSPNSTTVTTLSAGTGDLLSDR